MKKMSYSMKVVKRLKREGNFADADLGVSDVIQLLEDDEDEINRLEKIIKDMRRSAAKHAVPMMEDWVRVSNQYGDEDEEELIRFCDDLKIDLQKVRDRMYGKAIAAKEKEANDANA